MPGPRLARDFSFSKPFMALSSLVSIALCWSCSNGGSTIQPPPPPPPATFKLVQVANGFTTPLDIQQPDDTTNRLFVVEQNGHIQIILSNGTRAATPFLDVTGRAGFTSGGETGLLGLAFHPNYKNNRRFFVNYTRNNATQLQTVIAEFTASSTNSNFSDPTTENILFTVNQPFSNHNGGGLAFGKDGFLYIGLGDGGSGGDPLGNGQNTNTLLGKMLRIDVDSTHAPGLNYAIPPGNPFATSGGRAEIWLFGLRNPFRFSFDSVTGDLWIGDVGQDRFEEVDHLTAAQGGANLGWNIMEGTHCFSPSTGCPMAGLTSPVFDYDHSQGDETVIGGHVYRGTKAPALAGLYVFGDFISGRMWTLTQSGSTFTRTSLFTVAANDISSIGQDQLGELYVARYSTGAVSRIDQVGQP
ncbi:MAG TPA: PQQ-dependent sugar dehydrogenase [Candidatus Acidoferrum sp.]|nr:PQQ-dependent sugar dehydrogenase [Candidatus Acidoferrum sp.]